MTRYASILFVAFYYTCAGFSALNAKTLINSHTGMNISKISAGKSLPDDINVIIEIPMRADPIKYEIDKDSGALFVDRIQAVAMYYPANYGFVPHTVAGDGDPVDVLVVTDFPLLPGSVINARPVGVLMMEDEGGKDEKIVAVPSRSVSKAYDDVKEMSDLPPLLVKSIKHFFEHYKDLEEGKWVKIGAIEDSKAAREIIKKAADAAKK